MIIVTTDAVAGYQIVEVLGETMGTYAHHSYGLSGSTLYGGLPSAAEVVQGCRNEAMHRLWTEARDRGANAVVGMRYDLSQLAEHVIEACAYGTAVVLRPLGEGEAGATPQSIRQAVESGGRPASPSQPPPSDRRPAAHPAPGGPSAQVAGHQAPHPPAPPTRPGPEGQPPGTWQQPPSPGFR